ncbi:tyrosine-type recombinase/integrase [Spirosoma litoris]
MTVPKSAFNQAGTLKLRNWIKTSHTEHAIYNERIREQYRKVEGVIEQFEKEGQPPFSAEEIVNFLKAGGKPDTLLDYFARHMKTRKQLAGSNLQKLRTLNQYKQTYNRLTDFLTETKRQKFPVRLLSKAFVLEFRTWLLEKYAHNTASLKLACLRKISREAMKDKFIKYEDYPFDGVSIVFKNKTVSRLREGEIGQLAESPRTGRSGAYKYVTDRKHARPCAMLMYYLQGMRIGDFLLLRRENYSVENNQPRIMYSMGKSDKVRNVLLPPEAVELLAPYLVHNDGTPKKPKEFLFPYIISTLDKLTPDDQLKYINRATVRLSMQLKTLGEDIQLGKKLTPHIMRHSFADLLRRSGVDLVTAQMTMGHSDTRTTRRFYMEEQDQEAIDAVVSLYGNRKTIGKQIDESTTTNSVNKENK